MGAFVVATKVPTAPAARPAIAVQVAPEHPKAAVELVLSLKPERPEVFFFRSLAGGWCVNHS